MNRVAHTVMLPLDEYEEMKLGHQRYEFVRTLSPQQFSALWDRIIKDDLRWDDLIDQERRQRAKAEREAPFKYSKDLPQRRKDFR